MSEETKETEQAQKPAYGGQALIEGVMFAGKETTVSAIRRKNGEIEYFENLKKPKPVLQKLKKIPFVRGSIALIEAAALGSKHMNFASDRYDVHPDDDKDIVPEEERSKIAATIGVAAVSVVALSSGPIIFTLVPVFLAETLSGPFPGHVAQNLLEGIFKTIILVGYVYLISLTPLIKRVFQYHGAEHKVINAYEANRSLTVQNVQEYSRLHYRCGSSFMLFTVIIGVMIYLLIPFDNLFERIVHRLLLIPVVLGVSYEVLQATNKLRNIPVLKWLGLPGLWLQLLTTKQPKDDQVEVSIRSFEKMLEREDEIHKEKIDERLV
ncbi:LOW QUALITY PROTEIN: YqhQ protein [Geomicrobium sp. JCM 19037]|nr:LOW QUALITY PROTEIN: YqhQ protein [Geomicrobium sp. JCM 19037]